jgi:hypothetical protein
MEKVESDGLARVGQLGQGKPPFGKPRFCKAYGFALVTGLLFLLSWVGQFVFQYIEFGDEQALHGQAAALADFFPQFFAATLENWQSEFLQLIWQVVGLALFYHWGRASRGSPTNASRPSWTFCWPTVAWTPAVLALHDGPVGPLWSSCAGWSVGIARDGGRCAENLAMDPWLTRRGVLAPPVLPGRAGLWPRS